MINPTIVRDQKINLKHLQKILKLNEKSRNIERITGGKMN